MSSLFQIQDMENMRTITASFNEEANSRDTPESSLPLRKRLTRASYPTVTNSNRGGTPEYNHQPRVSPSTRLYFPFDIPADDYHQGYLQPYVTDYIENRFDSSEALQLQREAIIRHDTYLAQYPIRPTVLRLGPPKDNGYQGEELSPPSEGNNESMRKRRPENDVSSWKQMKRYRQKNLELAALPNRRILDEDSLLKYREHSSSNIDEECMEMCDEGDITKGIQNEQHCTENVLVPLFTHNSHQYSDAFVHEFYSKLDQMPKDQDKTTSPQAKINNVNTVDTSVADSTLNTEEKRKKQEQGKGKVNEDQKKEDSSSPDLTYNEKLTDIQKKKHKEIPKKETSLKQVTEKQGKRNPQQWIISNPVFQDLCLESDVVCHVNGVLSLPGVKETRYPITVSELKRRTSAPENLTRVEMIAYVRQSKSSGRLLLDKHNVVTSGKRSRPTVLSRLCEDEARMLADGVHKMNLQYFPVINLIGVAMRQMTQGFCQQKFCNREIMTRKVASLETTRSVLRELRDMMKELIQNEEIKLFELASHCFGTRNLLHHIDFFDKILALYSSELQNFM